MLLQDLKSVEVDVISYRLRKKKQLLELIVPSSLQITSYLHRSGMLWALLGIEIQRFATHGSQLCGSQSAANERPMPRLDVLRSALMIGIASALGYRIGLVLGLARDFWAVVTIIVAIRPNISAATTFTSMMVIGTTAGALIALITLENSNLYLRLALLFSFAVMVFATVKVNVILTQIFLLPFIIILMNIYYPVEWYLEHNCLLS